MKAAMLVLGCLLTASRAENPKPTPSAQKCPEEKISFTKETACRHDGYVFCIPERPPAPDRRHQTHALRVAGRPTGPRS